MRPAELGAKRLGFTGKKALKVHQIEWDEILDDSAEITAVSEPRRSGKSVALWCRWIGLCEERDDFMVLTSAQSGIMARRRFLGMARLLDRYHPHDDGGPKISRAVGHESFEWPNGAMLWVTPPKDKSVRGDAADVVFLDEQQELDAEVSYDLRGGVLPLLDTVADGKVVLAGTPGEIRVGWFWDALEVGRQGGPGHTLIEDAAEPGQDVDDETLWPTWHPGLRNGLTTLEKMRTRRAGMDKATWEREYCGLWPGSGDTRAISDELWTAGAGTLTVKPGRFALAFDTSPDSSTAALTAAWRDDEGFPHLELLMYGDPRTVAREAYRVSQKLRVPIAYDAIGANLEVAEMLDRSKPKPKTTPMKMADVVAAEAAVISALKNGELRHPDQPSLNDAAEAVAWRTVGDSGRLFGRRASAGDITPIVSGSLALLSYDRAPVPQPIQIRTRRSA